MALRASAPTVAALVAAYNEADRLGDVLPILATYPGFDEVIVVDDGSTDGTADVARAHGVTCIQLPENQGKGAALETGVRHAGTDLLFLADADIRDLDHTMIADMLAPVAAGEVDMFVAMRHRTIYHVRSVLRFLPLLGGERAVSAKLWHAVPTRYRHRFKIEAALNFYAVHHGRGLRYRVFPIRQTRKEVKYGLVRGMARRIRMGANVAAAIVEVQATEAPRDARTRRRAACLTAAGAVGLAASMRPAPRHRPGGSRARRCARSNAPSMAPRSRRYGATAGATVSALLVFTQLVRLAQSHARSDG